ncbi:MAG: apolipoprotein N-acyltransferase [Elusimicrobiota bacterium]
MTRLLKKIPAIRFSLKPALLCLLAGAALACCFPKPGVSLLAWFAPAVFFYFIRRTESAYQAGILGSAFGFAFCGVTLHWVYLTCRFAGVSVPVSALALAMLAGLLCLNWALYGVWARHLARRLPVAALPWAWALSWTALESASAHWTPRVAADLLAYTQWRYLPMIQVGALLGPHGLGFVIMLWNGALAEFPFLDFGSAVRQGGRVRNLALAGILILSCAAYGSVAISGRKHTRFAGLREAGLRERKKPQAAEGSEWVRIEVLQPNIDQYQKWDGRYEETIRGTFDGLLSSRRHERPDLVVWPESALPGWLDEPGNLRLIAGWARRLRTRMLVGSVSRVGPRRYNSAVLIGPDGSPEGIYHKRQLVPFGEFVPLRRWLEGSIGILAQMGDFDAGAPRQKLFAPGFGPLAVTICYEAAFPHLVRRDSARGARILVNVTNDGWYKDTAGPLQHFGTNVFRAVENRATVVRAANTGISGFIDPYGVVGASIGIEEKGRLAFALPREDPFPRGSLYSRAGDWFGFGAMLASAGLLAWSLRGRRRDAARDKRREKS